MNPYSDISFWFQNQDNYGYWGSLQTYGFNYWLTKWPTDAENVYRQKLIYKRLLNENF